MLRKLPNLSLERFGVAILFFLIICLACELLCIEITTKFFMRQTTVILNKEDTFQEIYRVVQYDLEKYGNGEAKEE